MQPARVADGTAFAGNTWTDVVLLPTHRTNPDGTQGASINWSSSVFTVDAPKAPTGVTITVTPNLGATPPSVTLSMSEATTSLLGGVFRWYLRESVVYGGDVLLWRLVRVAAEGGSNVNGAGSVIQLTVPTAGDVIAVVLPEPTVVQQTGGSGGGGAVASVFGRTGTVTAQTGDYTAAQVGADTSAARDTAISAATAPLATSSALTTGLAGKQPIDTDLTTIAALDSAQSGVVASDGAGWIRKTYAQLKTALSITAADVGADTSAARDTAISTAINNLINSAPGTLDTLGEIATALQADESTAASLATTVAGKQPLDADLTAIAALDASTAGAIASDGAGWVKKTYAQFKTALGLVKADVGLGNVDNTSDLNKPVSTAQAAADAASVTTAETYADRYAGSAAGTAGRPLAATDATTTNARTPLGHHATHSTGGSDPIAPVDIGAAPTTTTTTGPPTTGTWVSGNTAVDGSGRWWVCEIGGTPGYWTLAVGETFDPFASRHMQRLIEKLSAGSEDAVIVICGDSTSNDLTDWFYPWLQALAALFPAYTVTHRLFTDGTFVYAAPSTVQTGSGPRTLTVYNASIGGQNTVYSVTHFAAQFLATPDLTIVNYGHNNTASTFTADYTSLTSLIASTYPMTGIICSSQNPRTDSAANADLQYRKMTALRLLANRAGHGFIDVMQAFLNVATWASTLMNADGVHPKTPEGFNLWRDEWLRYVQHARRTQTALAPPAHAASHLPAGADSVGALLNVLFGDGSDGVVNFDGSATVLGLVPASGVYTLTRDLYLDDGSQISGTAQIIPAGARIFCRGKLTVGASAKIQWDGAAGSGATPGAALSGSTNYMNNSTIGGAGGAGNVGAAGSSSSSQSNALGGRGGAGGGSSGGGTGGGPASGSAIAPAANVGGMPRNAMQALFFRTNAAGGMVASTGGSGGNAAASSTGGGGGSGGGCIMIYALSLVLNGTIEANGGVGGAASGSGTGAGGGGGGGGGAIVLVLGTRSGSGTLSVAGAVGGAPQGAGSTGATGAAGNIIEIKVA